MLVLRLCPWIFCNPPPLHNSLNFFHQLVSFHFAFCIDFITCLLLFHEIQVLIVLTKSLTVMYSLRFCTRSLLHESLDYSLIDKIPGRQNDRRTLLGELNWIFTAVTDTIAWNVLPHGRFFNLLMWCIIISNFDLDVHLWLFWWWDIYPIISCVADLFQRLFRQDLLVASLFRNFLLAERIMRSANCSPISHPMLPPTHQHHMWYWTRYFPSYALYVN